MSDDLVLCNEEGRVATLTVANPPLNVLSSGVVDALGDAVARIADDPGVSVVVLTGAGNRAFVAGGDIKKFPRYLEGNADAVREGTRGLHALFGALEALDQPVIAAINGLALGGGCEMAMACDIRIAEEQAKIGLPEIKLGIFPGAGGTQRLPRLIGAAKAKEMMFTGEPLSAEAAYHAGLINKVVPQGRVLSDAQGLAARIAEVSLPALARIKRCVNEGKELNLTQGLELEKDCFAQVFQTRDAKEGVEAFIQKRPPRFLHR